MNLINTLILQNIQSIDKKKAINFIQNNFEFDEILDIFNITKYKVKLANDVANKIIENCSKMSIDILSIFDNNYPNDLRDELYKVRGKILSHLKENNNSEALIKTEDIQNKFEIAPSTVSEHLCALEKYKLIKRENKGKIKYIKITKLGESYVK